MKNIINQRLPSSRMAGFTLIEIMVVVVILAILAAAVMPNLADKQDKALVATAKTEIRSIESALTFYKMDHHSYPTTEQGLEALVKKPEGGDEMKNYPKNGYLQRKKLPVDPWGSPYQYLSPGTHGDIDIYSLGPDKQPSDDDIGNWNLDEH
ncbi:MAG: type II secretion system major pseudopilin GspG [Gammaproteobacteria bacterium]|nr:type II secretion system major pseudopilin GspG [Gammaproteobacteria bacterium]MDH5651492.1 type II secretion system major pseudopilin GspG [Gammaproteobacteria bacterium]